MRGIRINACISLDPPTVCNVYFVDRGPLPVCPEESNDRSEILGSFERSTAVGYVDATVKFQ